MMYCITHEAEGRAMKYPRLIEGEAKDPKAQAFLTDDSVVPMAIGIPSNFHDPAKESAPPRDISLNAFARTCMIQELSEGG